MSPTVYALLVGIDMYQRPVRPLSGCVNDMRAIERLLRERVAQGAQPPQIRLLLDAEATREAIIDGFRSHLAQAGPDDIALFYFSGHGSQQPTAPEFWASEPDRKDETLVCFDSRINGRFDLADKELSKLISEVAQRNPQVVIILDCCHSGTATRAADGVNGGMAEGAPVRRAPMDERPRPFDSYLVSPAEAVAQTATRSAAPASDWVALPPGKHLVLSACRAEEEAREYFGGGQQRGAFSYFLLDTLARVGGELTYRDLFKRASALVRNNIAQQTPLIEASDAADLDRPFLGGAVAARSLYWTLSYDGTHGWVIDGGAVHGIPAGSGNETSTLALFPITATAEAMHQLDNAVGQARVVEVLPHASKVAVTLRDNAAPDPAETYKGVVTGLPLPPLGVLLEGDAEGVSVAQAAWSSAGAGGQPSLYVQPVPDASIARLRLVATDGAYHIRQASDGRLLTTALVGYTDASAWQAVQRLEHIARWVTISELANPASKIASEAVRLEVYRVAGPPVTRDPTSAPVERVPAGAELRFDYEFRDGQWHPPQFKLRLHNTSSERLYCVLLDLTERFAVDPSLLTGSGAWLEPNEEVWALDGKPIYATVPQELWQTGVTEYTDIVKLIVSTEECDATLLQQGKLDTPVTRSASLTRGAGTLNRLLSRVQTRELSGDPDEAGRHTDWTTLELSITTFRPQQAVAIAEAGRGAALGAGVFVHGHPSLQASARLSSVTQAGRDLGNLLLPALLRDDPEVAVPFQFSAARGSDPGLSVLELFNVQNPEVVTPDQPLIIEVAAPLDEDERVLPVAFDGEFFLPLGLGTPQNGGASRGAGGVQIRLDRLPEPVIGARSLTGSIRIFFQKVVTQRFGKLLGWQFQYPLLAAAYTDHAGHVTYWQSPGEVQARVAAADKILLYVHGIIGDTRGMAASSRCLGLTSEPLPPALADRYDLVLTYDYENINTTIEDNARGLKQRLREVGLGAGHAKTLHVVAHSMGGLVARWLIEREGGSAMVQRLVLLGTPNAGSPWPKIQDFATAALAMALNGLTATFWPAKVLGTLVAGIEKIDVALDQMQPGSDVLRTLHASPDPQIPYTIIAGNTSLVPAAVTPSPQSEAPLARLLGKLSLPRVLQAATGLAFWGQPNDIAVTVNSIRSVPLDRAPAPVLEDVACDHITYFSTAAGLHALARALDSE